MKVKVVIFNHDQRPSAEKLVEALDPHFDVALFDSGSAEEQISPLSTERFENIYWTGCWNKAWELFPEYDVIWGIGGDCELRSQPIDFKRAIESAYPFGIWSPAITGRVAEYMAVEVGNAAVDNVEAYRVDADSIAVSDSVTASAGNVATVKYVEGIAFAISKQLWETTGIFDRKNYIGWGQDIVKCHQSTEHGMSNLIDSRVQLFHPPSDRYNNMTARLLMVACMRKHLGADWESVSVSLNDLSSKTNTISIAKVSLAEHETSTESK